MVALLSFVVFVVPWQNDLTWEGMALTLFLRERKGGEKDWEDRRWGGGWEGGGGDWGPYDPGSS